MTTATPGTGQGDGLTTYQKIEKALHAAKDDLGELNNGPAEWMSQTMVNQAIKLMSSLSNSAPSQPAASLPSTAEGVEARIGGHHLCSKGHGWVANGQPCYLCQHDRIDALRKKCDEQFLELSKLKSLPAPSVSADTKPDAAPTVPPGVDDELPISDELIARGTAEVLFTNSNIRNGLAGPKGFITIVSDAVLSAIKKAKQPSERDVPSADAGAASEAAAVIAQLENALTYLKSGHGGGHGSVTRDDLLEAVFNIGLALKTLRQRPTDTAKPNQPGAVEAPIGGWTGYKCPKCRGTGESDNDDERSCSACAGTGDEWSNLPAAKPSDESAGGDENPFALTEQFHAWLKSLGLKCVRIEQRAPSVQAAECAGDTLAKRIVKEVTPSLHVLGDSLGDDAIVHMVRLRMTEIVQLRKEVEESAQAEREATRRRCGELHAKMVEAARKTMYARTVGLSIEESDKLRTWIDATLAAVLQSKFGEGKQ